MDSIANPQLNDDPGATIPFPDETRLGLLTQINRIAISPVHPPARFLRSKDVP
jgi:hypothetical protein